MNKTYLILILILVTSCKAIYHTAPNHIKRDFTYKYDNLKTGIDTLINIYGYYTTDTTEENRYIIGTYKNVMFFDDGIFLARFHDYNNDRFEDRKTNIPDLLKEVSQNDSANIRSNFYDLFSWGKYSILSDTIKVQFVRRPMLHSTNRAWYLYEIWYKIIDRNTIIEVFRDPPRMKLDSNKNYVEIEKDELVIDSAIFIPVETIPTSNGWIKYESWFWSDINDYEEWKAKNPIK
jgi:hypothetical protein